MNIIFYIVLAVIIMVVINNFFVKKDYFNATTYIFLGIIIPLILYFFKWSELITISPTNEFYLIFIYFFIITFIFCFSYKKYNRFKISFDIKNEHMISIVAYIYILLYLIENYIGSATLFPALKHIDIHTYSAPLISYITRNLFVFLLIEYIAYLKTKKKKYLFEFILLFLIPFITRSARFSCIMSLLGIISFGVFYRIYNCEDRNSLNNISDRRKNIVVVCIVLIVMIAIMSEYTNYRTNQYGKLNVYTYSDSIKYCGPKIFENIIATYYGYFPLSFNNLNYNLHYNRNIKHNYIGLYTFVGTYFGIFQLDNLLQLNPYQPSADELILTGSATVATAFYNYYYDYGMFCFVPMIVAFIIYIVAKKRIYKSAFWMMFYFYFTPNFFFYSFQNVSFTATTPYVIILIFILSKLFIKNFKGEKIE